MNPSISNVAVASSAASADSIAFVTTAGTLTAALLGEKTVGRC